MTDYFPNETVEQAYNLGMQLRANGASHEEMVDGLMENGFAKSLSEHIAKDLVMNEHDELHPHDEMIEIGWMMVSFGIVITILWLILFRSAIIPAIVILLGFIAIGYGRYLDAGIEHK